MPKARKFSEGLLDDRLILQSVRLAPGQTVIDAGCGSGYMAIAFAHLVGKMGTVYALDVDPHLIATLQQDQLPSSLH